jgi:hypothetical protein
MQVRIIATDMHNNTVKTPAFESRYEQAPDTTALILLGIVLVVVVIALVIVIQKKYNR